MEYFRIAGINVGISGFQEADCEILSTFKSFKTLQHRSVDMVFRFKARQISGDTFKPDFYIDPLFFRRSENGLLYFMPDDAGEMISALADTNWSDIEIASASAYPDPFSVSLLTDIAFRTRLPEFSGFSLHASVVDIGGAAVLFAGPSGIGKSTQAELWRERFNATIINGDYGVIRQSDKEFNVYGSPWSGTSPYITDIRATVAAVVLLEQAEYNDIAQLSVPDATQGFVPNCMLPYWHQQSLGKSFDIISNFLNSVPVYLLKCLPNMEAAELAYSVLFGTEGARM